MKSEDRDGAFDVGVVLAELRYKAELTLLATILAGPRQSFRILGELGFELWDFKSDDLRAIVAAVHTYLSANDSTRLEAAGRFLRLIEHWDDDDHRSFVCGGMWSPEKLATLWTSGEFSESELRASVELLREIYIRERDIRETFQTMTASP